MLNAQIDHNENYKERVSRFNANLDFGLFSHLLLKSWWIIVLFFIISFSTAFVYLRYAQRVYQAGTVIQINDNNQASEVLQLNQMDVSSNKIAEAIEQIHSKVFLKRVVDNMDIQVSYFNEGTFKNNELYKSSFYYVKVNIKSPKVYGTKFYIHFSGTEGGTIDYMVDGKPKNITFFTNSWVNSEDFDLNIYFNTDFDKDALRKAIAENSKTYFLVKSDDEVTNELQSKVDVKLMNEMAKTILVSVKDVNAEKAKDIVNALADEYLAFDVERKSESSKSIISFIDNQLKTVYDDLKLSENNLENFRKAKNYNDKDEVLSANLIRLNSIDDQLLRMEMEEKLLAEIQQNIDKNKSIDTYQLVSLVSGTEYEENIKQITLNIQKMLVDKENMLYEVTPNSENIKQINYQIENQKRLLMQSLDAVKVKYKTKYRNLLEKSNEFRSKYDRAPEEDIEHSRLMRLFSISEKYYTLLLEKKTEFSISKAGFVSQNVILERAVTNRTPISPSKQQAILIALLSAILLSIVIVFIRYLFHDKITTVQEIIRDTNAGVSVLGIVPKVEKDIPVSQLLVDKNPKSLIAESFRSIRTNLQFINNDPGPKVAAVTSSISGEGKTFVAINLAGIIAYSGKKVIIIDLDMRKPKIHLGFNAPNEKGMSTILTGIHTLEECVVRSDFQNLSFITAGPIPPNPSELIMSPKLEDVLDRLKKEYDLVVLDNPPVGLVTDGIMTIQKADYPIYVFRAEYSKKAFIQILDRLKNENKVTHLSVILNGVDMKRKRGGYGYGYGYSYGYGYGSGYYGEDETAGSRRNLFKKKQR